MRHVTAAFPSSPPCPAASPDPISQNQWLSVALKILLYLAYKFIAESMLRTTLTSATSSFIHPLVSHTHHFSRVNDYFSTLRVDSHPRRLRYPTSFSF